MAKSRRFRRKSQTIQEAADEALAAAAGTTSATNASASANPSPFPSPLSSPAVSASLSPMGGFVSSDSFVTQPPKPNKGLTGKISTLFRRESNSREIERDRKHTKTHRQQLPVDLQQQHQEDGAQSHRTPSRYNDGVPTGKNNNKNIQPGRHSTPAAAGKRIFYSSNNDDDDDSQDSYESRATTHSRNYGANYEKESDDNSRGGYISKGTASDSNTAYESNLTGTSSGPASTTTTTTGRTIRRYRGFSTSIKSLFLDESLVCGACGCFGLILSQRTEFLLQLRNERRGLLISPRSSRRFDRKPMPSKIMAGGLFLTLILMFSTFIIWGFGTGNGVAGDYLNGYAYNGSSSSNNGNNQNGEEGNGWWDDYLKNDDAGQNNQQQQYDDVYDNNNNQQQNYNDDDAAAADANANDDAEAQQQYDDAYNEENGDDAVNNNNNDDAAVAEGDDYYKANDDNGNRRRRQREQQNYYPKTQHTAIIEHSFNGIFKMRDYQENLWYPIIFPVIELIQNDWNHQDLAVSTQEYGKNNSRANDPRRRRNEEAYDDVYDENGSYLGYKKRRNVASDIRVALLIVFLVFLGILGRRRRMRARYYLVKARAQEDHLYYASNNDIKAQRVAFDDTREDQYEGACSHTLCGCYPADEVYTKDDDIDLLEEENVEVADKGLFRRKRKPYHEDIVARTFNCLMSCCCGYLCKCWFQCLSICALAQEAREMRLLIPPRYQRIDFITHQPFHEYQNAVNDLRRGWLGKARKMSGIMPHYYALSRLSRYILILSIFVTTIIVATLVFNPRAAFSWQDAVVLLATFVQSFLVLFFVHWIFHKSDLSLDGVIKMFAAGFLIAVPTAFFFEGILVNLVLFTTWILYDMFVLMIGDGFSSWVFAHWRAIWITGELFNAYVVAAITEELCKYYTFRAVEHPDLVFLTGLQREDQADAEEGGVVQYPFSSLQVQKLARAQSFGDMSQYSNRSSRSERSSRGRARSQSRNRARSRSTRRSERLIEETGTTEGEFDEDENDVRTRRQKAMAITTGMISVAVGLACAENFLYVFVLGGAVGEGDPQDSHQDHVWEAWIVLFFRSIFPVHALAAAMQSINMIRKFVEFETDKGHRVGVGRIIMPAVIVHGSFDAILMGINVFVETAWDRYLEENEGNVGEELPYNAILVNTVAWVSITFIMAAAFLWYYRENRLQSERLKVLEEQDKSLQADWDGVNSGEYA